MAKKVKGNQKSKKRSFKISEMDGRPCLKINGNYLATEYGFEPGSRVEVTKQGDSLIITKIDQATIEYQEALQQRRSMREDMKKISQKIHLWDQARNSHALG